MPIMLGILLMIVERDRERERERERFGLSFISFRVAFLPYLYDTGLWNLFIQILEMPRTHDRNPIIFFHDIHFAPPGLTLRLMNEVRAGT